jgi:hypothetical protein
MVKVKIQEVVKTNEELKNQVNEKLEKAMDQVKKKSYCMFIIDMPLPKKKSS